MTEKDLENLILEYCALNNIFAWKNQTTGIYDSKKKIFRKPHKYQINGVSDIIMFFGNEVYFIEVKAPLKSGKPRKGESILKLLNPSQKKFKSICDENNIHYYVFDNFDAFKEFINWLGGRL